MSNLKQISDLEKQVEKYQKYKTCLSKNVFDLQERYKLVKEELSHTQKQLYSLQVKQ